MINLEESWTNRGTIPEICLEELKKPRKLQERRFTGFDSRIENLPNTRVTDSVLLALGCQCAITVVVCYL
jgi:hypothetical protein